VEFRILGPLEVWSGGRPVDLGGLRQRRVLAALLLSPNRVVALSRLADAGWGADPPPTVERQVRNRVAALRGVLTPAGGLIDTDGDGYRLRVGPDELDAAVFE
jgi:DNA-binding SARP family transcriptional activator